MRIQYAKFPMKYVNITQVPNGGYSHKGRKTVDNAGKDTGIDDVFAPFDCKVVWKDTGSAKTGIVIQNTVDVLCADGITRKADTIQMMLWHDNYIGDLKVGQLIKQGEVFYQEGTAGYASGNHLHFNLGIGTYQGGYPLVKNSDGNWEIKNEIDPTKIFFLDSDNKVIRLNGMSWVKYVEPIEEEVIDEPKKDELDWSKVDKGIWNGKTTLLLQKYYKTVQDSVISGQVKNVIDKNIKDIQYGVGGSRLIKAMQKDLNLKQTGYINPLLIKYLQRRLGMKIVDGFLSTPSSMVEELQRRLLLGIKI